MMVAASEPCVKVQVTGVAGILGTDRSFLNVVLETTRADVNAAALANEAGEDRRLALGRTGVKLNEEHLEQLRSNIEELLRAALEHPDDDGVWTTFLWTAIDRQDRRTIKSSPAKTNRSRRSSPAQEKKE